MVSSSAPTEMNLTGRANTSRILRTRTYSGSDWFCNRIGIINMVSHSSKYGSLAMEYYVVGIHRYDISLY